MGPGRGGHLGESQTQEFPIFDLQNTLEKNLKRPTNRGTGCSVTGVRKTAGSDPCHGNVPPTSLLGRPDTAARQALGSSHSTSSCLQGTLPFQNPG